MIGFFHGYAAGDFLVTFWWWLAASVVAGVLTVPSWPFLFQRHRVIWADELAATAASVGAGGGGGVGQGGGGQRREKHGHSGGGGAERSKQR